jgi:sugar transferase (PEP-CTERM system associated)
VLRIFRHYLSVNALCLLACESTVMVLVLLAATGIALSTPASSTSVSTFFGLVLAPVAIYGILMYSLGLYDRPVIEDWRRALPRLVVLFGVCTPLIIVALNFAGPDQDHPDPGTVAGLWSGVAFCGVLAARLGFVAFAKSSFPPHRVLVIGVGERAAEIEYLNSKRQRTDCEIVGYTALVDQSPEIPESRMKSIKTSLLELACELGAKEIVVALDDRRGVGLQPLLEARMNGIVVTNYLSFWEREARRVNLKGLDPSWLIYSDGFRVGTFTNALLKRVMDVLASLGLLILMLPTLLLACIAVRLETPGPIFYRQERVGRNGALFTIYKFRTMCVDAEGSGVPQWAAALDSRITRVGWILRMTRFDELPQIWNVLRGDMSFVGPRPERPFFVKTLSEEIPFYSERHRVRPGITGWAQIKYPYGASIQDAKAKLSYDLYYIKNFSLLFDFLIILSTARAIFLNKGAR